MTAKGIPQALSKGEETFYLHCRANGIAPYREYIFHQTRRWRFDFFFPKQLYPSKRSAIGIEIDGGNNGRHQRRAGFEGDCYKLNAAAEMGILVLRYTTDMVMSGEAIDQVLRMLK